MPWPSKSTSEAMLLPAAMTPKSGLPETDQSAGDWTQHNGSESAPHHLKANAPTSRNRIAIPRTDLSQWHAYVINALILAQADVIPATYQLPPSYH